MSGSGDKILYHQMVAGHAMLLLLGEIARRHDTLISVDKGVNCSWLIKLVKGKYIF